MKSFRRLIVTSLLILCAFGSVVYTSCKDKCGSTTCQNGGTCSDNVCVCPVGYSGNACQTGWSTVAIGTYNCTRSNCRPAEKGAPTWQSSITADATNGGYTIDISNFDNNNVTLFATIDSANVDSVSTITISAAAGAGVNATGTYKDGIINLIYTTYSAGVSVGSCSMIMIKE